MRSRMLFSTAVICPFCCLTRRPSWRLHRCGKQLSHPMEKLSAGHTTGGADSGQRTVPQLRRVDTMHFSALCWVTVLLLDLGTYW